MPNAEGFGNFEDAIKALYYSFGDGQAALTNVPASASSAQLLAATSGRKGCCVFNDADKALFLKFGATASATSFTVKVAAGDYYEFPAPCYVGRVDGIWEAAPTGSARVTELT